MQNKPVRCDTCRFGIQEDDTSKNLICHLDPPVLIHSRALASRRDEWTRPPVEPNDFCRHWHD